MIYYVHVCVNPSAVRQSFANLWDHPPSWLTTKLHKRRSKPCYFLRSSIISVTNHYKPLLFGSFEMIMIILGSENSVPLRFQSK